MSIGSTNPLRKDSLDDALIGRAVAEDLTNVSDTVENLEVENDLTNELFEQPESVMDKLMASVTHARYQKIISDDMLSKT